MGASVGASIAAGSSAAGSSAAGSDAAGSSTAGSSATGSMGASVSGTTGGIVILGRRVVFFWAYNFKIVNHIINNHYLIEISCYLTILSTLIK